MVDEKTPALCARTQAILTVKLAIAREQFSVDDFKRLLAAINPQNPQITFSETVNTVSAVKPIFEGEDAPTHHDIEVPGFEIRATLPDLTSRLLLAHCLPKLQHYPERVTFTVSPEKSDKHEVVLRTHGEFFFANFKNPAYSIGVDMARFARYNLFKLVNQTLAEAQVYQYSPGVELRALIPLTRQADKSNAHFRAEQLMKTYIPYVPEINQLLKEHLSIQDHLDLQQRFTQAVSRFPEHVNELKLQYQQQNKPQEHEYALKQKKYRSDII